MAPRHSSENGSSVPLGEGSATSEIVEQARSRSDGFEMGGDRAIVSTPNWNNQESNQLYLGATQNNDPGTAEATGQAWSGHGDELLQVSNELYSAISELGNVWIGQGAAAAQGALVGIANSGSQASEAAKTMATRLAQQAAAAAEVKKMPAPKDYDPARAMTAALAGGPAAMIADQKVQADAAADVKAQQVAFFNAYTKSMSDVDGSTPSFGPESLGMKPVTGHGGPGSFGNVGSIGGSHGVGTVGHSGPSGTFGGQGADGSRYAAAGFAGAGLGPDSGHFSQAGFIPGVSEGGVPGGGAAAPGPAAGVPAAGTGSGAGAVPQAPMPGGGGSNVGQALGLAGLGAAGLGGVGGVRSLGQGNRSGNKSSDSTAAAANEGSGQSAASVAGPQQGLVSAGGTIGGSPTPPPMGGMGGMGGGAQQQEDEEHTHASFLIDPDPDETFGANEATPPPVIGAWSDDDDR
jgi:hypothetical protein